MSILKVGAIQNAAGVEVYTCKAWVNFNGTGTVAIRASGNVSSITDNATGDYTVNFTTAMPDSNYCTTVGCKEDESSNAAGSVFGYIFRFSQSTSAIRVGSKTGIGGSIDSIQMYVAIFR